MSDLLNMMGFGGEALVAGIEDETILDVNASGDTAVLVASAALAESGEALNFIEAGIQALSATLMFAQSQLQNTVALQDTIETAGRDGLTQREATFVHSGIDGINQVMGENTITMPALEAFGDSITAKNFTEVGMESISDGAKVIWEKIQKIMFAIADQFAAWWTKFFGQAEKLKSLAEALKAKAGKYKGDKKDKVKASAKLLSNGATASTSLAADFGTFAGERAVIKSEAETADKFAAGLQEVLKSDAKLVTVASAVATKLVPAAEDFIKATGDTASAKDGFKVAKALLGGKAVGVKVPELPAVTATSSAADVAAYLKGLKNVQRSVVELVDAKKAKDSVEFARVGASDVEKMCDAAIEIAEAILDGRKGREDARKEVKDLAKAGEEMTKALGDDDAKALKPLVAPFQALLPMASKNMTGGVSAAWSAHMVAVSRAALKVADKSVS